MLYPVLFFSELLILFFLSQLLTRSISQVIFFLTKSKHIAAYFLAVLFLPGTIIHELSHFLMAKVLFVPTEKIHLWPHLEGDGVRLGSVGIGQTDMLRRILIGSAPFLIGTTLLFLTLSYVTGQNRFDNYTFLAVAGYIVFEIGNTMFSSKKDREGMLGFFLILGLIFVLLYILGVRVPEISLAIAENSVLSEMFEKGTWLLAIPILIDITIIAFFHLILRLFR